MAYDASLGREEKTGFLFQPDTLLPGQYIDTVRRKANSEPEKKLLLMILEDAVDCFQKYVLAEDAREKILFAEAERWIMEEKSNRIFSFENVCDALGFDPRYIRQGLLRWKETKLAQRHNSTNA